jgi:hypothetical protein
MNAQGLNRIVPRRIPPLRRRRPSLRLNSTPVHLPGVRVCLNPLLVTSNSLFTNRFHLHLHHPILHSNSLSLRLLCSRTQRSLTTLRLSYIGWQLQDNPAGIFPHHRLKAGVLKLSNLLGRIDIIIHLLLLDLLSGYTHYSITDCLVCSITHILLGSLNQFWSQM